MTGKKNQTAANSDQGENVKKTLDELYEDYEHINPLKEEQKDPDAKPLGGQFTESFTTTG